VKCTIIQTLPPMIVLYLPVRHAPDAAGLDDPRFLCKALYSASSSIYLLRQAIYCEKVELPP
jgi:hypothetical protein